MAATFETPFTSPYHGQALQPGEIRLLTILWTRTGLELRTECHRISDSPEFDAISYVWGTAAASCTVMCNGRPLCVTPTALEMIWHLYFYRPEPTRPIWIDAICINQDDADEKAVQVPQMRRVYHLANSVIVWMCSPTFETTALMTGLNEVPGPWDREPAASVITKRWPFSDNPFWLGMIHLLATDWFQRLWTFQEVALAKTAILLCGTHWLNLDHLLAFALNRKADRNHFFGYRRLVDHGVIKQCHYILRYRRRPRTTASKVIHLLQNMRRRQAREEVDRIWALFGLFDEELQRQLAPLIDYSETARTQHWLTLVGCMKRIAQMSTILDLFEVPASEYSKSANLPSWCPDFRGRGNIHSLLDGSWNRAFKEISPGISAMLGEEETAATTKRRESIYRHTKRHISVFEGNDFLGIRGFEVDTIAEVVEEPSLVGAWEYIEDYSNSQESLNYQNPEHVAAMTWLSDGLDLAHRTHKRHEDQDLGIPQEFLIAFMTDQRVCEDSMTALVDAIEVLTADDYNSVSMLKGPREQLARHCIGRFRKLVGHSFFSTAGGRFGLATPGCKPGDKVSVFYGGEPLYILRSSPTDSPHTQDDAETVCTFVGTAYIPHLMDQHTVDDARQGPDQMYILA